MTPEDVARYQALGAAIGTAGSFLMCVVILWLLQNDMEDD